MAIIGFAPSGLSRGPRSMKRNQDWTRNYTATYLVVTDTPFDGPGTVAANIPYAFGSVYVERDAAGNITYTDIGAFISGVSIDEDTSAEDGCQWVVTLEYGPYQPLQNPQDPTQRTPEVSFTSSRFQRPILKDVTTGDKIANSAGDPFNPAPERDDSRTILTIKRAELNHDPLLAANMRDKINEDQWGPYPAETVKTLDIPSTYTFNADIGWYWEVTYSWEINLDKWQGEFLDCGFNQLDATTHKTQRIILDDGSFPADPVPLDGNGQPEPRTSTTNNYMLYDIYEKVDFSIFNMDDILSQITGT